MLIVDNNWYAGRMGKEGITKKKHDLVQILGDAGSVLVAFSGGVDSTLLLAVAHETLGAGALAATAVSDIYPVREKEEAVKFARQRGIEHIVFQSEETGLSAFVSNGPDRCYHCKKALFGKLIQIAGQRGIKRVLHGANVDDLGDYRPGFRAAKEMGITAPLVDARLTKQEIRFLSKHMDLSTWDKPTMACLASRIPYGSPITSEKLKMIEEAEAFLCERGIRQCRVRHHGAVARIEVESGETKKLMEDGFKEAVVDRFRQIGFMHVSVDLEGYVSGSMNRVLALESKPEDIHGR